MKRIDVYDADVFDDETDLADRIRTAIDAHKAYQGFWIENDEQIPKYEWCDAYRVSRQGDLVVMWVPKGTPRELLPEFAKNYLSFGRWEPV